MHILRRIFSNVLLSLVLGLRFASIQAQETDTMDTNATTALSITETVKETLRAESTSALPSENILTALPTEPNQVHPEFTQSYQMSTMLDKSTAGTTVQHGIVTEQTTPTSVFEKTTAKEPTTMTVETTTITVTESATSLPTTSPTTGGLTTADLISTEHHKHETTTATNAVTTGSTEAFNPTTITSQQTTDRTESSTSITSKAVDATTSLDVNTTISTTTPTFTSQFIHGARDPHGAREAHHSTSGNDLVSTHFTPYTIVGIGNARESISLHQTQGFLITIVCVSIVCVLFGGLLLFILLRKKNNSQKFGPGYMNGQSKNSKKKKGVEKDAWAGPVHLEAGERVECDGEVHGALESANGNRNEDMVLSTFAPLETDNSSNGGVGGEGTKEAKKWEEQEPLLYIDEDEDKITEGNNQEKPACDEKTFSGEAFCLTTAV